ncbi:MULTISPECIES: DUF2631 domain-containing protein [Mycolicibacterium]|uniref:DUF2631 domain-containing protein n=1 Tax=Mycolicibacterium austroafricanum TaxID=39687 RepID=A0ABT8HAH2_MYCAO|nr:MULTISPECIES: DUF2631 domain-containing protein [Mycolicibacterium]MDN4517767.1 DUF2631 domain-containing protein [Mycolicibacterium austroafricanum]MDW5613648.1 DUF2631 domain-containing protein [Mycolicibacterium sp. D5.8-2]PQP43917.1 DUF2631 domain-containing protein [Mycolicibacterium austroafricanum]QRZ08846.1 DUF2631 domain-containing protein [Mycolicibacterium austroafricanum]QZT59046.1 DUF2631 domain-containing protein [Mycolicibacterium austroafricanum]
MASTEVERHTGVDVEDVPSAEWGWSTENYRFYQIGGLLAAGFLLLMTHGNHTGHVEDWFMIGFAAVLVGFVARSFYVRRNRDTR